MVFVKVLTCLSVCVCARQTDTLKGKAVEHTQSHVYACVLECSLLLRQLMELRELGVDLEQLPDDKKRLLESIRGRTIDDKIVRSWGTLQGLVDCVCDSEMNKPAARRLNAKNLKGVKQVRMMVFLLSRGKWPLIRVDELSMNDKLLKAGF